MDHWCREMVLHFPLIGDINSGKSTLVDRLCQVSQSHPLGGKYPLSGCSLEYRFIDVQDEETDGEDDGGRGMWWVWWREGHVG